ncbi:YjgN family protein [Polaromonas sp.]|uniref:YjgN family protein n=1 Tax=Polaromonas sp. TaxID=1869339 RepID=UPI00326349E9
MNDSVSNPGRNLTTPSGALDSQAYQLRVEFTGSGSEYFRIWIVNLLLLLVTLGIYYPWAKVRRLRYFYGNTLVDGEPLDFHGNPLKMLKGYLLVGLLFGLYSVAGNFSAMAGFVAFVIVTAIWPALLKSSMQFRMANTSWRGLRFGFRGSLGDAYRAVLPMFLPGLVILGAVTGIADPSKPPNWYGFVVLAVTLVSLGVAPWLLWNLKQYQHNHYALASLQTSFKATLGSFYKVIFKTVGVMLLAALLTAAVFAAIAFAGGAMGRVGKGMAVFVAIFGFIATTIAMLVVVKPYVISRMQNLVWTRTGNASLRFLSHLRFRALLGLTLKNWLLVIVTLGLYWPFAAVALARIRLEAVTVKSRVSPDTLVSQMRAVEGDAAGDAAGDMFGIDIGL